LLGLWGVEVVQIHMSSMCCLSETDWLCIAWYEPLFWLYFGLHSWLFDSLCLLAQASWFTCNSQQFTWWKGRIYQALP